MGKKEKKVIKFNRETTSDITREKAKSENTALAWATYWWGSLDKGKQDRICRGVVAQYNQVIQSNRHFREVLIARFEKTGVEAGLLGKSKPAFSAQLRQHMPTLLADPKFADRPDSLRDTLLNACCEEDDQVGKAFLCFAISMGIRAYEIDQEAGGEESLEDAGGLTAESEMPEGEAEQENDDQEGDAQQEDNPNNTTLNLIAGMPGIFLECAVRIWDKRDHVCSMDEISSMATFAVSMTSLETARATASMLRGIYPNFEWICDLEDLLQSDQWGKEEESESTENTHRTALVGLIVGLLFVREGLGENTWITKAEAEIALANLTSKSIGEALQLVEQGGRWALAGMLDWETHAVVQLTHTNRELRKAFYEGFQKGLQKLWEGGEEYRDIAKSSVRIAFAELGEHVLRYVPDSMLDRDLLDELYRAALDEKRYTELRTLWEMDGKQTLPVLASKLLQEKGLDKEALWLAMEIGDELAKAEGIEWLAKRKDLDGLLSLRKRFPETAQLPALQVVMFLLRNRQRLDELHQAAATAAQGGNVLEYLDQKRELSLEMLRDSWGGRTALEAAAELAKAYHVPYQPPAVRSLTEVETTSTVTTAWLSLQAAELLLLAGEQGAICGPNRNVVLYDLARQNPVPMAWALGRTEPAIISPIMDQWDQLHPMEIATVLSLRGPGEEDLWQRAILAIGEHIDNPEAAGTVFWQKPPARTWPAILRWLNQLRLPTEVEQGIVLFQAGRTATELEMELIDASLQAWRENCSSLCVKTLEPLLAKRLAAGLQPPMEASWVLSLLESDNKEEQPAFHWLRKHSEVMVWLRNQLGEVEVLRAWIGAALRAKEPEEALALLPWAYGSQVPLREQMELMHWLEAQIDPDKLATLAGIVEERQELAATDPETKQEENAIRALAYGARAVVTVVGGNEENQGKQDKEIEAELHELYPGIEVRWRHTGWSSNWGRFSDRLIEEANSGDAAVIHIMIRTNLGRTIREGLKVPWRACTGTGKASMLRAIVEAAIAGMEKRVAEPAIAGQ